MMAWRDDKYCRRLLDKRETWGTMLSTTGVTALLFFLTEHPHHHDWLNYSPLAAGVFGSLYVLIVGANYEQAEAFAKAQREDTSEINETAQKIKNAPWYTFIKKIGILGRMNVILPVLVGAFATMALCWGGFGEAKDASRSVEGSYTVTISLRSTP